MLQRNSAEFGVTVAAIPVVLILLFLCSWAVEREVKSWGFFLLVRFLFYNSFFFRVMTISLVMMLAALSYCMFNSLDAFDLADMPASIFSLYANFFLS